MDYKIIVEERLKNNPKRLKHTYGVIKRSLELGKIYNADLEVLQIASLLHDITKHETDEYHINLINDDKITSNYPKQLWHAFSAAKVAKQLGVTDKKIIEAIKYHVFGKIDMSIETMILVVSDFCEEGRTFPFAKKVYEKSLTNLVEAYLMAVKSTIDHILKQGLKPLNIQIETYLYYKKGLGK